MASVALRWHALIFTLVNAFLGVINFVFSPSTLWFLWVTGPWSMGLIAHAFAASSLSSSPASSPSQPGRRRGRRSGRADAGHDDSVSQLGKAPTRLSTRPPPGSQVPGSSPSDVVATHVRAVQADSDALTGVQRVSALQVGQRVADRFVIERQLGKGGMGEVYLARDALLDGPIALKTIAASLVSSTALERFRREAQAARRVTHPNVVRIHDVGQDGALAFISMEYVEGETLGRRVHRERVLPSTEIKRIALQICDGLIAAHAAGVVHRDLKPDNILLDGDDHVRVIDFGLARLESSQGLTATGTVMGTPDYMAPEQVQGRPADARTDVYALGCVLHHAFTGTPPFPRESAIAVGMAHCQETPPSLHEKRPDVSEEWNAIVMRALEKEPAQRFQSVAELRDALANV